MAQFLWRKILQLLKENAILLQSFLGLMIYERGQGHVCFCIKDNKSNIYYLLYSHCLQL